MAALGLGLLMPSIAATQDLEAIAYNGFESGTLGGWQAATDGGDLSASPAAAMVGSFGLEAVVDDTAPLYVQDDLWAWLPGIEDESYFHASFRFDPNGFDPGEAEGALRTRIFIGFQATPQRRLFALVLRRRGGQFSLMGRVREDDNREVDTGFVDITDDPHLIEVDWHQSSSADARNGLYRVSIDGIVVATLRGLDNSISGLDFVRLGALSVKGGASGSLRWDEYTSFRDLAPARAQLVINEVDYDQPGADTDEFVEIFNPGPALADAFVYLVMIDGSTHYVVGAAGRTVWLKPGEYLVFASPTVAVPAGVQRVNWIFDHDMLQNGSPEGIVLTHMYGGPACAVIDVLSYEGPMSAPLWSCGLVNLVEGNPLSADIADSDVIPGSLVRLPNGSDTNDAATDWSFSTTPTPGRANVP